MRVHLSGGARQFLASAEPLLRSDPFSTNIIAVVAGRIAAGDQPDSDRYLWATVEGSNSRIVGTAMHTPPHHLFVSRMPPEAAASLANFLDDVGRDLSGVNGAVESTRAFAATWTARTGRPSAV